MVRTWFKFMPYLLVEYVASKMGKPYQVSDEMVFLTVENWRNLDALRAELAARDAEIERLRKETIEDRLAELCVLPNVENVSLEPPTGCGCCYDANQWKCYWDGFGGHGKGNTAIEAIDSAIRAALEVKSDNKGGLAT